MRINAQTRFGWLRMRTWLCGLASAGILSWASLPALGQAPPAPNNPRVIMMRSANIKIPILVDPQDRPNLESIHLFAREGGAKAPWIHKERVTPDQSHFLYNAAGDGEYWFSTVSVDKNNKATPGNLDQVPPGLVIVVDTQPPSLDVRLLQTQPEGIFVQVDARDPYLDPSSLQFHYQTLNKSWQPLDPTPQRKDTFCIPSQAAFTGMVKVSAQDQAKNLKIHEVNLSAPVPKLPTPTTANVAPALPTVLPETKVLEETVMVDGKLLPPEQAREFLKALRQQDAAKAPEIQRTSATVPAGTHETKSVKRTEVPVTSQPEIQVQRQLVNDTRLYLDYALDAQGAGGVGKVDFWHTRDRGKSWHFLATDPKKQSPAEIRLPEEGLFGIKIVVANQRGFGAEPPKAGDQPDWWVEVDKTSPRVKLTDLKTGTRDDNFAVHVSWSADDKNLADDPIEILHAPAREGPWTSIVKGLKNDGQYRWNAPMDIGKEVYIRVVARDQAGNAALSEITKPWPLDDGSRPVAIPRGVSTMPPMAQPLNPLPITPLTQAPNKLEVMSIPMAPPMSTAPLSSQSVSPTVLITPLPAPPVPAGMRSQPTNNIFQPTEIRRN